MESFNMLDSWISELKLKANPSIKIFLVGSKSDLKYAIN